MAMNDKHNLIGYDPLAWMGEEPDVAALMADIKDQGRIEEQTVSIVEETDLIDLAAVNEDLSEAHEEPVEADIDLEQLGLVAEPEVLADTYADGLEVAMEDDIQEQMAVGLDESALVGDECLPGDNELYAEPILDGEASTDADILDGGDELMSVGMVADDIGLEHDEAGSEEIIAQSLIHLESNLTIQNVVKLHEVLKASLSAFGQIEVDASAVSSIDTATLQLLVSLKQEADKSEKQVDIIQASPRFVESAKLLGLMEILNVDL